MSTVSIMPAPLDLVKLKELRVEMKLSLQDVAEAMGRSVGCIQTHLRKSGIEKARPKILNAPFGWDLIANELVENAKEQKVLREISRLYKQNLGAKKIAKILNEKNIPTKFGGKWWPYSVSRLKRK